MASELIPGDVFTTSNHNVIEIIEVGVGQIGQVLLVSRYQPRYRTAR